MLDSKYASSHGTEYADQFVIGARLDLEKIAGLGGFTEAQINITERNGRSLSQTSDALNEFDSGVDNGHLSATREVWGSWLNLAFNRFCDKKKFFRSKIRY